MGIGDDGILSVGTDVERITVDMVTEMMCDTSKTEEGFELISIYYGEEITDESAETLKNKVAERYPDCDIELQYGGQPIYYYIVSAE
jgi:hypothetical protein